MFQLRSIPIFLLLIISSPVAGQINIAFLKGKDSTLAVFGSGWDNKIRVNNMPKGARVEVSHGLITKLKTNEFVIHRLGEAQRLGVKVMVGDSVVYSMTGKVVHTKASGSEYNPIYKPQYDKIRGLYILGDDSCRIVKLAFTALPKRGDLIGPYWLWGKDRLKEYIGKTVVGTKVFIDDIMIRCPCDKEPFKLDTPLLFITTPSTY